MSFTTNHYWIIIQTLLYILANQNIAALEENEKGPDYGSKWLSYVDENGTVHQMNFSSLPVETRGMILGRVHFYLYTRRNSDEGEVLIIPRGSSPIKSSYFNASNNIKAITHGWMSKEQTSWLQNMKNSFLKNSDVNVITIDWSELAKNPLYPWPALCTRYVGKRFAKLLSALSKTYDVQGRQIHLIGHSLGAHIMGYTGMFSQQRIDRITGLDPARPLFELPLMRRDYRLDKSDAKFVDIIHTCGGVLGYRESYGHADFYPNGGKAAQPGCEGIMHAIESCSHGRSHELFLESIDSNIGFTAYRCQNWDDFDKGECKSNKTLMGDPAQKENEGEFFLRTNNHSRYAMESE